MRLVVGNKEAEVKMVTGSEFNKKSLLVAIAHGITLFYNITGERIKFLTI